MNKGIGIKTENFSEEHEHNARIPESGDIAYLMAGFKEKEYSIYMAVDLCKDDFTGNNTRSKDASIVIRVLKPDYIKVVSFEGTIEELIKKLQ